MNEWISLLFEQEEMLKKGHCQRLEDQNLGMGWIYYGLIRLIRPTNVVVIGSWRGFSPLVYAKALGDNVEGGKVTFIDPSLVDDFWGDLDKVSKHFTSFGIDNIDHFLLTTQEFVETDAYEQLCDIGIVFIDGYHSYEQAKFDYESFAGKMSETGLILFHDSVETKTTPIYGMDKVYQRRVKFFVDELRKNSELQVLDLPFAKGLSIVRNIHTGSK